MKIFYTVFKMKFQNEISKSKLKMKLEMKFQIENFFSSLTFYIYYNIKLEHLSTIIFYLNPDLSKRRKKKNMRASSLCHMKITAAASSFLLLELKIKIFDQNFIIFN